MPHLDCCTEGIVLQQAHLTVLAHSVLSDIKQWLWQFYIERLNIKMYRANTFIKWK